LNTTVKIKGMSCNHCVMAVTKALKSVDGVREATVDLAQGQASIEHENPLDMAQIKQHVEKAGFELG
jgi:copper chaperone